jgi:outer membrane biosynthesis protein TonB
VKIVIAMLMLFAPLAAHGQLLKCVSKDGKVEYAANCPPGTTPQQTGIRSTPGGPAPAPAGKSDKPSDKPKTSADMEADFKKRQAEQSESQAKMEKEAAEKAQRQRACEEARNYLASLEAGTRISRFNAQTGEREVLEDAGRAQELARARESVQSNCK